MHTSNAIPEAQVPRLQRHAGKAQQATPVLRGPHFSSVAVQASDTPEGVGHVPH